MYAILNSMTGQEVSRHATLAEARQMCAAYTGSGPEIYFVVQI